MKNKALLIIVILIIILAVGGYLIWKLIIKKTPEEKAAESFQKSLESAAAGALPEISGTANPLEKAPDIAPKIPETNPIDQVNPFKDLKTNPFE